MCAAILCSPSPGASAPDSTTRSERPPSGRTQPLRRMKKRRASATRDMNARPAACGRRGRPAARRRTDVGVASAAGRRRIGRRVRAAGASAAASAATASAAPRRAAAGARRCAPPSPPRRRRRAPHGDLGLLALGARRSHRRRAAALHLGRRGATRHRSQCRAPLPAHDADPSAFDRRKQRETPAPPPSRPAPRPERRRRLAHRGGCPRGRVDKRVVLKLVDRAVARRYRASSRA